MVLDLEFIIGWRFEKRNIKINQIIAREVYLSAKWPYYDGVIKIVGSS